MRLIVILFSIFVLVTTYYVCSVAIRIFKSFYNKHAYFRLVLSVISVFIIVAILLFQTYDIIAQEFGFPRPTILFRIFEG